jgi:hypothetical protein
VNESPSATIDHVATGGDTDTSGTSVGLLPGDVDVDVRATVLTTDVGSLWVEVEVEVDVDVGETVLTDDVPESEEHAPISTRHSEKPSTMLTCTGPPI